VRLFGDRSTFAIEIGPNDPTSPSMRTVDVWIDGRSMCCYDNTAYVPQIQQSIRLEVARVRAGCISPLSNIASDSIQAHKELRSDQTNLPEEFQFMHWGPTTDNLISFLFKRENHLIITSEFWRSTHRPANEIGLITETRLLQGDLVNTLAQAIEGLG
jgi:hypothetical protein